MLILLVGGVWLARGYTGHQAIETLHIAASYYPLAEVATRVAGDGATIVTVTPPGEEPHAYHPSPQQLVSLQHSDAFIYNGATFEPWINEFLPDYDGRMVAASQGIDLLPAGEGNRQATDPHFWLDPVAMKQVTKNIRDALIEIDPINAQVYGQRAEDYMAQLDDLDSAFRRGLAACQTRRVVTSHEALRYLARRYNFSETSIAGISPEEEPTPARLAQLSQTMQKLGISTVLFETMVPKKLAETLAREAGATTEIFDPVEGLSSSEIAAGASYIKIQEKNLDTLQKAMKCQ